MTSGDELHVWHCPSQSTNDSHLPSRVKMRIKFINQNDASGCLEVRPVPEHFTHDIDACCDGGLVSFTQTSQWFRFTKDLKHDLFPTSLATRWTSQQSVLRQQQQFS